MATKKRQPKVTEGRQEKHIKLALSGGGFRATLFHLGVIRYLCEKKNDLLKEVGWIASVSGGSILAAHLVLNWDDYTDKKRFPRAARAIIDLMTRDVRGRVFSALLAWSLFLMLVLPLVLGVSACFLVPAAKGWLLLVAAVSFLLGLGLCCCDLRVPLLLREYGTLFKDPENPKKQTLLGDLGRGNEPPELFLVATSLTTGELCCFTKKGFHRDRADPEKRDFERPELPVRKAVAASSAFPPAFPPVVLERKELRADEKEFPERRLQLTDGGVYDNIGLAALEAFAASGNSDLLIISNAEPPFGWQLDQSYRLVVNRATRASSILMSRVSEFQIPREYDLRLMFALNEVRDLPTEDKNQIIVADVKNVLHFRIFDHAGKMVVDTDEGKLVAQADRINALRDRLAKLRPPHELSPSEKREVITAVTSIVGGIVHIQLKEDTGWRPSGSVQRMIQHIRTDLNSFSVAEIQLLVYQGYAAAYKMFDPPQGHSEQTVANEEQREKVLDGFAFTTPGEVPYVNDEGEHWLPFSVEDVGRINAEKALRNSDKLSPLKMFIRWRWFVVLIVLTPLLLLWVFWKAGPARPEGVQFACVPEENPFVRDRAPLLSEVYLLRKSQVGKDNLFVAKTKPLSQYVPNFLFLSRKPAPFKGTLKWPSGNPPTVIQVRAQGGHFSYQILNHTAGKKSKTFNVTDVQPDDYLLLIGSVREILEASKDLGERAKWFDEKKYVDLEVGPP